jgi:hypothetical protein
MIGGRTDGIDGWIAARRCLEAMRTTEDAETRLSLWKAAKRYASKGDPERTGDYGPLGVPRIQGLGSP